MYWLPCGTYNVNYKQDFAIFRTTPHWISLILFLALMVVMPFLVGRYILSLLTVTCITIIAVQGLGILTGFAGQISLG